MQMLTLILSLKTFEIAFDRTCNLACSYCNASFSQLRGPKILRRMASILT